MQTLADIMQMPIKVVASDQACALGAAMFGAVVSGYYKNTGEAIENMRPGFDAVYEPRAEFVEIYRKKYNSYLTAAGAVEDYTH